MNNAEHIEDNFEIEDSKNNLKRQRLMSARNALAKKSKTLVTVIIVVLFIYVAFSVYRAVDNNAKARRNELVSEKAREAAAAPVQEPAKADTPVVQESPQEDIAGEGVVLQEAEPEPQVLDKITNLREVFSNDDIVGYLKIDGTDIDYAVAQYTDNEFYLDRDLDGEKSVAGSVFMDYESSSYELKRNTVIYGHNMKNGTMFHNLRYYMDPDYFKERRFVSLTTIYEETKWEIFAFYETGTDFYYIQVNFPSDESFEKLLTEMKAKSLYDTGVKVGPDDKILTLSTCAGSGDTRYVLNAKLIANN